MLLFKKVAWHYSRYEYSKFIQHMMEVLFVDL